MDSMSNLISRFLSCVNKRGERTDVEEVQPTEKYDEEQARVHLGSQIAHEEALINHRMTWMLTIQGFLFATLAILARSDGSVTGDESRRIMSVLFDAIPVLGFLIAFFAFLGMFAAYTSIDHHKKVSGKEVNKNYPGGNVMASVLGRIVSMSIPGTIALTWLYFSWKINWQASDIAMAFFFMSSAITVVVISFKVVAVVSAMKKQ